VTLARDAEVRGGVGTVNGNITLAAARVAGGLRTHQGDIEVGAGSRVEGGIRVEKSKGFNIALWKDTPKVVIGPGAVVDGALEFEREVKLYVSDSATIGEVKGATAIRFSGDEPKD
jgi:cytoskeletal protein CcmA (bactofilin family)